MGATSEDDERIYVTQVLNSSGVKEGKGALLRDFCIEKSYVKQSASRGSVQRSTRIENTLD